MKHTATGHDSLPLFIFKDNINILIAILHVLFSRSIQTGVVPDSMKMAKVTSI